MEDKNCNQKYINDKFHLNKNSKFLTANKENRKEYEKQKFIYNYLEKSSKGKFNNFSKKSFIIDENYLDNDKLFSHKDKNLDCYGNLKNCNIENSFNKYIFITPQHKITTIKYLDRKDFSLSKNLDEIFLKEELKNNSSNFKIENSNKKNYFESLFSNNCKEIDSMNNITKINFLNQQNPIVIPLSNKEKFHKKLKKINYNLMKSNFRKIESRDSIYKNELNELKYENLFNLQQDTTKQIYNNLEKFTNLKYDFRNFPHIKLYDIKLLLK